MWRGKISAALDSWHAAIREHLLRFLSVFLSYVTCGRARTTGTQSNQLHIRHGPFQANDVWQLITRCQQYDAQCFRVEGARFSIDEQPLKADFSDERVKRRMSQRYP